MNIIITSFIIIFTLMVLLITYGVVKEKIKKNLIFILFTITILIYYFVKPLVLHTTKYSISGNSIVRKATLCLPPLFKCSQYKKDIVMFTIKPETKNIYQGKIIFEITKDDNFNILTNRKIISELLKTLNIEVLETNISTSETQEKIILEITTGDCAIISDLREEPCLSVGSTGKKRAEYIVSKPIPDKLSCLELIGTLSEDVKKGYNNWYYDGTKNIIYSEKECLDIDCKLTSDIIELTCNPDSRKNYAYYNVTPNIGTGISCSQVASRLTQRQKTSSSNISYIGNWYYDQNSRQIRSPTQSCIPDISCTIVNENPIESSCNLNTVKVTGTYNLTTSEGKGESCSSLFNRVNRTLNTNYTGWAYDSQNNKIVGEKNCCVNANQRYYKGTCVTSCPNDTYTSKNDKLCLENCNLESGITVIDEENKKCLPFCPNNKSYLDTDTNNCTAMCLPGKFEINNKCYTTCPDDYYNNTTTGKCTQYSLATQQELVDKLPTIPNNNRSCQTYKYSKISDSIEKVLTENGLICGNSTQNGFKQNNYCMEGECRIIGIKDYSGIVYKINKNILSCDKDTIIFICHYNYNSYFDLYIYNIVNNTLIKKKYDYSSILIGSRSLENYNSYIENNIFYIIMEYNEYNILVKIDKQNNYSPTYYKLSNTNTSFTLSINISIKSNYIYIINSLKLYRLNITDNTEINLTNELLNFIRTNIGNEYFGNYSFFNYIININNNNYLFINLGKYIDYNYTENSLYIIKVIDNENSTTFEKIYTINGDCSNIVYHSKTNKLIISCNSIIKIYNTSLSTWLLEKEIVLSKSISSFDSVLTSIDTKFITIKYEDKLLVSKDYGDNFLTREKIFLWDYYDKGYMSDNGQYQSYILNSSNLKFKTSNLLTKDAVNNELFDIIHTTDYGDNWSIIQIPNKYTEF